jgi:hypothetical protein
MDLYNDLEELRGMTRLLIDDVNLLRPKLGEGNPDPSDEEKANRRFYVRAVFALVEAFVEQHRRLLVHLGEFGKITLPENRLNKLREIKKILDENGAVVGEEANYMRAHEKIKEVYNAAAVGFDEQLTVTLGNERWPQFKDAMHIRHEITHPKNVNDCWIFEEDIQKVIAAHEWFKTLQNDFVRIARLHREKNRGKPSSW